MAEIKLLLHVLGNLVQRNVSGAFDHDLHAEFRGAGCKLPENLELAELGLVIGVGKAPGPQAVPK